MNTQENENHRAYLKEKAHAWQARYDEALDRVLGTPASTREDFLDVIWNHGILNRIAPTDPEERAAREELRSDLWKGTREDQELYQRIMYSAGSQEEAMRRNLSAADGGLTAGISQALGALMTHPDRTLWERFMGNDPNAFILIASIKERAIKEMRAHGGVPHEPLIPWGAEGNYKGIPVMVERYTGDGSICLRAQNSIDHMRLGEVTNFSTISPTELNPDDFKIPEAPEHFEHELEVPGGRAAMTAFHTIRNLLAEHHIREEHKTDWTEGFIKATKNFDGKKVRVRIVFNKNTGLSFEIVE